MNKPLVLLAAFAATGLMGCAGAVQTQDPFKALESVATNPPLKDLTVGVVISSKSKVTLEQLKKLASYGPLGRVNK